MADRPNGRPAAVMVPAKGDATASGWPAPFCGPQAWPLVGVKQGS
jgi:hypothetical protein